MIAQYYFLANLVIMIRKFSNYVCFIFNNYCNYYFFKCVNLCYWKKNQLQYQNNV